MNFTGEKYLAIDIETHEHKDLKKYGPGSHRHYLEGEDSEILGVAISTSNEDFYFPATPGTFKMLREIQYNHIWIGHNILYDLSWLYYEGFRPRQIIDTMHLVKMLDENRLSYSLDACGSDYLGVKKLEDKLEELCLLYGLRGKPQKHLRELISKGHGDVVAEYAKKDTRITYDLYLKLIPEIEAQELSSIWGIEKRLLPILADNHHKGLRIDESKRQETSRDLEKEIKKLEIWLFEKAGRPFKEGSGKQLKEIFDQINLSYDLTEKGNPSFKSDTLLPFGIEPDSEYFPHVLVSYRKLLKLKRDFVDRLGDFIVDGRIRPMINPLGTKTGRPTATVPNIFQIPKRGRGKKLCRSLFLPEPGEVWVSADYASEELRVFAHYASGEGSSRYRDNYNNNLDYDMHIDNGKLAGLINDSMDKKQKKIGRTKAKTIGLGVLFGMGDKKMASNLCVPEKEGSAIVQKFHSKNPSFKYTSKRASEWAKRHGFMRTLSKRRRRFPGGQGSFKALNFLTQGNSADLAKISLVKAHDKGMFEKMTFLLWLYDEYNFSIKKEDLPKFKEFKELAETAIKFNTKMSLDMETGPNWGDLSKEDKWKH